MQENQRHLNFNKFVEERSIEIAKFLTDLELDTKKKGHQALPRSIRRRAMSHNRYRIPKKLRKNMEDQLAKAETMQKIPKCRKHIRKRRGLIMAYKLRSGKVKWLSTHLWSARRMRMVDYYGYKIAQTANNKCFRSAYRHFRHNCCMLDLSYFNCLSLHFQSQSLPALIHLKSPEQVPKLTQIYEISLYSSNSRERFICPAYLIRFQNQKYKLNLKIFFHPAALTEVSKISFDTKVTANLEQGQCDVYLITGPESANVLTSALQQYGILKKDESLSSQFFNGSHKLVYLSKEQNYEIVNKPQVDCPIPADRQIKKQYNSSQNISLRQKMLQIFQNMKKQVQSPQNVSYEAHHSFWEYYEKGQNKSLQQTVFKITLRSRYTHKRNNKVSKAEKKKIVQAQRESPSDKKRKRDNSMKDENESSESLNFSKQVYLETPIHKNAVLEEIHPIIVGQVGEGLMKGLLVFGSNANSCKLWRILSHFNIKIVGRREYAHMHLESNSLLFPQNFIHTNSYVFYHRQAKNKLFGKHMKVPLQKQPHYFSLNSPFPFGFLPKHSTIVSVEMVGKGRCFEMSYICELQEQDLPIISNCLDNGKIGIVQSEGDKANERKRYKVLDELESDLRLCEPKRRIIGHITSGGYLFSRSREGGIGFIDRSLVAESYLQKFGGYVFIRKTTSRHYMLATITNQFQ